MSEEGPLQEPIHTFVKTSVDREIKRWKEEHTAVSDQPMSPETEMLIKYWLTEGLYRGYRRGYLDGSSQRVKTIQKALGINEHGEEV